MLEGRVKEESGGGYLSMQRLLPMHVNDANLKIHLIWMAIIGGHSIDKCGHFPLKTGSI